MVKSWYELMNDKTKERMERNYRQTGWIGTVEMNRDAGLEPGQTFCLCVSPGSSPVSRFTSTVPIHPV